MGSGRGGRFDGYRVRVEALSGRGWGEWRLEAVAPDGLRLERTVVGDEREAWAELAALVEAHRLGGVWADDGSFALSDAEMHLALDGFYQRPARVACPACGAAGLSLALSGERNEAGGAVLRAECEGCAAWGRLELPPGWSA